LHYMWLINFKKLIFSNVFACVHIKFV
jgi:hypothetical protein